MKNWIVNKLILAMLKHDFLLQFVLDEVRREARRDGRYAGLHEAARFCREHRLIFRGEQMMLRELPDFAAVEDIRHGGHAFAEGIASLAISYDHNAAPQRRNITEMINFS